MKKPWGCEMEEETKREGLERILRELGLTDVVVFGKFEEETLPALYGDPAEILSTVMKAVDADPIWQKVFFAVLDGYQQGKMNQAKESGEPEN
jgi:hypothetical protein